MPVQHIHSQDEFEQILKENKVVMVDFTATWCGPCKFIGPIFERFSDEYPNIKFIKVDVDEVPEVAEAQSISAMPTFLVFVSNVRVTEDDLVGASETELKKLLEKHSSN